MKDRVNSTKETPPSTTDTNTGDLKVADGLFVATEYDETSASLPTEGETSTPLPYQRTFQPVNDVDFYTFLEYAFPWLVSSTLIPLPASNTDSSPNETPTYTADPQADNMEHAASAAVVSEMPDNTRPSFVRDSINKIQHIATLIKSFLVDSGSTRNICRHRSWFEPDFSEDAIHHIRLRGIVNSPNSLEITTIQTRGFGYVNLSTFLGLSNVGITLRIPCYWCPDASDDVLSTDILKQGVSIRIPTSHDASQHVFKKIPLYYSTENDTLYNELEQIVIPLRRCLKVTSANQGTGFVLSEQPHQGGSTPTANNAETKQDTVSLIVNSVDVKANDLMLNPSTMTTITKKILKKFDADILNRHTKGSFKDAISDSPKENIIQPGDIVNGHYFAFPSFEESPIHEIIRMALKCFLSAALTTSFTFVLPLSKKSLWWSLVSKYFEIVLEIDAGTKSFMKKDKEGKYVECSHDNPSIIIVHLSKDSTICVDNWILAHCRFNHMGGSTLNRMISSGANLGLVFKEASSFILCHVCNTCKATRPAVRNLAGKERSALPSPLHELYMDIHGPINPESVLGYRYVLGFICSATGYAFIYFLKRKSESARAFKDLVLFLLSHKTLPVEFDISKLTLICDNAGEFTSSEFQEILEKYNIKQELTSPYAHHQALFIERLWRTLADASRTMLATAGLDFIYWPLAFRHAVHVYRLMPHRTRDESVASESPHFKLFGIEPDLSHLRIFGSDAFPFLEKTARDGGKMTATRAKYGRYVGHDENLQTILILNTTTNKVYRAGLVKIVENIDQVGRVISNPDVSVPSYQYASHDSSLYTRPTPFTKKKNFSKVTSLLSIASYYDDEDKETYGLIQFTDSTHESAWTYVILLSQSETCSTHYSKLLLVIAQVTKTYIFQFLHTSTATTKETRSLVLSFQPTRTQMKSMA